MTNPYQVGVYLRLSKEDSRLGESGSITNQRSLLMNYIKENNLTFIREYVDDGISGTTFNRPSFNEMLKDINNKTINMVITKDTSRLGRDHIEFGYYVEKYFPEHNIRYVAVCDNIDTFASNNDMLLFKSAYNDMYVKDISNKIRASLNIKKQNGEFVGTYAPYGYLKDSTNKHKLIIDEETKPIVKRIFNLFIKGTSITKIANILTDDHIPIPSIQKNMNRGVKSKLFGIWTPRTITDILTNPTYIGNLTQGRSKKINYKSKKRIHTKKEDWIITKNTCPAIIDENIFNLAQSLYQSNKFNQTPSNKNNLLLKGLVYCQDCNHTIGFRYVKTSKKQLIYGNCNYYLKKRRYQACTPHSVNYHTLEQTILSYLKTIYLNIDKNTLKEKLQKEITSLNPKQALNKEKQKLINNLNLEHYKLNNLYLDKLSNFITKERYLEMASIINENITKLNNSLNSLNLSNTNTSKLNYLDYFDTIFNSYLTSKIFITSIIDKILIDESGHLDLYLNISTPKNY